MRVGTMEFTDEPWPRGEALIESGWKGFYHYITESPEDGDYAYEHYHLRAADLVEKFPYLKKYISENT
jgi:hypothetical protein